MATSGTRDRLVDRMLDLTPREFEVLCKTVLADDPRTASLTVTPASQDGGIDVEGRFSDDWFAADFGVQVKRYGRGNRVGTDRVHRLAGSLTAHGYDLGTLVTTSSYTGPATETARNLPVQLVSGTDLADAMLRSELGVSEADGRYEFDATFWDHLRESDERVPASDVPLANDLDKVADVLAAIRHTDGSRDEVRRWLADSADRELSERHVYINANSATALGLARKEPPADGDDVQRWGLTESGAEYLQARPGSDRARRTLHRAIRSVDLVERVMATMDEAGELSVAEIDDLLAEETTGLSESSVGRRASAVRTWVAALPEVEVDDSGRSKRYAVSDTDEDGSPTSS